MQIQKALQNSFTTGKLALVLLVMLSVFTACTSVKREPTPGAEANMPNPASVYCEQQGYTSETITAEDGSQSANCVFPDGSKCDEWAFYRGECAPDSQSAPGAEANMPNPASAYCEQQGYTSETITAADGSQSANCVFPDGSKCDEWAFYRGECGPLESPASLPDRSR